MVCWKQETKVELTKEGLALECADALGITYGKGIPHSIIKHPKLFLLFVKNCIVANHREMSSALYNHIRKDTMPNIPVS